MAYIDSKCEREKSKVLSALSNLSYHGFLREIRDCWFSCRSCRCPICSSRTLVSDANKPSSTSNPDLHYATRSINYELSNADDLQYAKPRYSHGYFRGTNYCRLHID